jgi:hypothetical protein
MGGRLSFEKGAVLMADKLALPSPGYREALLADPTLHPLATLLAERAGRLSGIASGVDYRRWNPATDPYIHQQYDSSSFELKRLNRRHLQAELGLPLDEQDLLIGYLATAPDDTEVRQLHAERQNRRSNRCSNWPGSGRAGSACGRRRVNRSGTGSSPPATACCCPRKTTPRPGRHSVALLTARCPSPTPRRRFWRA